MLVLKAMTNDGAKLRDWTLMASQGERCLSSELGPLREVRRTRVPVCISCASPCCISPPCVSCVHLLRASPALISHACASPACGSCVRLRRAALRTSPACISLPCISCMHLLPASPACIFCMHLLRASSACISCVHLLRASLIEWRYSLEI